MKKVLCVILSVVALVGLSSVRATTVIPPTFDELVGQAEVIFEGTVTNVKSEWVGEGAERVGGLGPLRVLGVLEVRPSS